MLAIFEKSFGGDLLIRMRGTHSHDLLVAGHMTLATASTAAHDEKVYGLMTLSKLQNNHICAFLGGQLGLGEQEKRL